MSLETEVMHSLLRWTALLIASSCPVCAVWNEGYFLVEQRYVQTNAGSVAPESTTNTALRFTIRKTAPTQTAVITRTNVGGGVITVDPIGTGTLIGAHYNKLFSFSAFGNDTNTPLA